MSQENLFSGKGRVGLRLEPDILTVRPGGTITFPLLVLNQGDTVDYFELAVRGIPTTWLSMPSPVLRLAPGEQREVPITIQPPAAPQGSAGRLPISIKAASQEVPAESAEVQTTLTVAALEVQGRISLLLAATEFSAAPGGSVTIPIVLINQGLEPDSFQLGIDGIPPGWVSTSMAVTQLSPGQQQEVSVTISPPASTQSRAGHNPFKIKAMSQMVPGQQAEAECTLTIAAYSAFTAELRPASVEAGEPARVIVENKGNTSQIYNLSWRSPEDSLIFEPAATQELRVPPGELAMVEFRGTPAKRPFLGGELKLPFATRVQAGDQSIQNLRGQVTSRAILPSWVVPAVLVGIMVLACIMLFGLALDRAPDDRPTKTPPPDVAPTDIPSQPTQLPPTDVPPPEPTQEPPPEPTQEPPPEPTAEPPPEPTEPPDGGGRPELPCLPAAAPLFIVPLLVFGKKRHQ